MYMSLFKFGPRIEWWRESLLNAQISKICESRLAVLIGLIGMIFFHFIWWDLGAFGRTRKFIPF